MARVGPVRGFKASEKVEPGSDEAQGTPGSSKFDGVQVEYHEGTSRCRIGCSCSCQEVESSGEQLDHTVVEFGYTDVVSPAR